MKNGSENWSEKTAHFLIKLNQMTAEIISDWQKKCLINQSSVLLQSFPHRPLHLFIPRLYILDILYAACPPRQWSTVSGSVFSLAARRCPWPDNSDTDWTNSTPNLLSSPTLYNVREPRITWLSSALCHFQRNAFVILGTFSWNCYPEVTFREWNEKKFHFSDHKRLSVKPIRYRFFLKMQNYRRHTEFIRKWLPAAANRDDVSSETESYSDGAVTRSHMRTMS